MYLCVQPVTFIFSLSLFATKTQIHPKVISEKKMSDIPVSVTLLVDAQLESPVSNLSDTKSKTFQIWLNRLYCVHKDVSLCFVFLTLW